MDQLLESSGMVHSLAHLPWKNSLDGAAFTWTVDAALDDACAGCEMEVGAIDIGGC